MTTVPARKKTKTDVSPIADFERSLKGLEAIVERLERGEQSLEESLRCFEEGIALSRRCQEALTAAEQRVRMLVESAGGGDGELVEFEIDEDAPRQGDD